MTNLYNQKAYPQEIANEIQKMLPLATQIANRWMLGWPKTVKALIASGEYLEALTIQEEEEERKALSDPSLNHLSSWEKAEVMGLTQAPPSPSTEPNEEA